MAAKRIKKVTDGNMVTYYPQYKWLFWWRCYEYDDDDIRKFTKKVNFGYLPHAERFLNEIDEKPLVEIIEFKDISLPIKKNEQKDTK